MKRLISLIFVFILCSGVSASEKTPNSSSAEHDLDKFYDNFFDDEFFRQNLAPFKQMEKIRKEMDKLFKESTLDPSTDTIFDNWFANKFGGELGDIEQKEDAKHVSYYIHVPGLEKENINVDVKDEMVNISGKMKEVKEKRKSDAIEKSTFSQRFERQFPVPPNVDSSKVDFKVEGENLIIQFPKKIRT